MELEQRAGCAFLDGCQWPDSGEPGGYDWSQPLGGLAQWSALGGDLGACGHDLRSGHGPDCVLCQWGTGLAASDRLVCPADHLPPLYREADCLSFGVFQWGDG